MTNIVEKKYSALFDDIRINSALLDNWLNESYEHFDFHNVEAFFDGGLDSLMKKHHPDLYISMRTLHDKVIPELKQLKDHQSSLYIKLVKIWEPYLNQKFPDSYKKQSSLITGDLIASINEFNVMADLLVGDKASIMNKLRDCILKWQFGYRRATNEDRLELEKTIDVENLTEGLVKLAEPSSKEVILLYQQLQPQNYSLLKESLLPLLQKYIAQPI